MSTEGRGWTVGGATCCRPERAGSWRSSSLLSPEELGPGGATLEPSARAHPARTWAEAHQQRAQRYSLGRTAAPGHRRPRVAFGAVGSGPKREQRNRAASGSPQTAPSQRHKVLRWETGRPGTFVIFK